MIRRFLRKENISIGLYDLRFIKPLDTILLHNIFLSYSSIITIEDGCIQGGVGSCILEFSSKYNYQLPIKILGVPDKFIPHGTQEEQKIECGIDKKNIFKQIRKTWKEI